MFMKPLSAGLNVRLRLAMRLIPVRVWFSILLSAVLQMLPFPLAGPVPAWRTGISWIALAPLFYALMQLDRTRKPLSIRRGAMLGYLCGIVWYAGNCYWIYQTMYLYGGLSKPVSVGILFLFSLYLGLYHGLFAALFVVIRRSYAGACGALLAAPFLWVAVELARGQITGFPWDLLGYTQIDNLLLTRLAPITGVMGMSLLIVAVNAGIASLFLDKARRTIALPIAAVALALILEVGGRVPALQNVSNSAPNQVAVLMQENLNVGAVGREVVPLTRSQEYEQFINGSLHPYVSKEEGGITRWSDTSGVTPNIIVWPEAPSHFESSDPYFRAQLGAMARSADAAVVAGSLGVDMSNIPARGYYLYDSASVFDRGGEYRGRYDKIHLVPWGEYIPFKEFFSFAQKLTEGAGDMDRGKDRSVFKLGDHTYGAFVCYESIFGDEVRQFAKHGAEVLVNISDDGWYGDTGAPWQHLNMARMRAIENHRWVLRSTNTGITTAIDPRGQIAVEAPRHVRGAFVFRFGFAQDQTIYTRYGDWLAYLCALITAAVVLFSFTRRMN